MKNSKTSGEPQKITVRDYLILGFKLGCVIFVLRFVLFCLCRILGMAGVVIAFFIIPEFLLVPSNMIYISIFATSLLLGYFIAAFLTCVQTYNDAIFE